MGQVSRWMTAHLRLLSPGACLKCTELRGSTRELTVDIVKLLSSIVEEIDHILVVYEPGNQVRGRRA